MMQQNHSFKAPNMPIRVLPPPSLVERRVPRQPNSQRRLPNPPTFHHPPLQPVMRRPLAVVPTPPAVESVYDDEIIFSTKNDFKDDGIKKRVDASRVMKHFPAYLKKILETGGRYLIGKFDFNLEQDPMLLRHINVCLADDFSGQITPKFFTFMQDHRQGFKKLSRARHDSDQVFSDRRFFADECMMPTRNLTWRAQTSRCFSPLPPPIPLDCGYFPIDIRTDHDKKEYVKQRYLEAVEEYENLRPEKHRVSGFLIDNKLERIDISKDLLFIFHMKGRHIHGFFIHVQSMITSRTYLLDFYNLFLFPSDIDYDRWDIRLKVAFDHVTTHNLSAAEFFAENRGIFDEIDVFRPYEESLMKELMKEPLCRYDDLCLMHRIREADENMFGDYVSIVMIVKDSIDGSKRFHKTYGSLGDGGAKITFATGDPERHSFLQRNRFIPSYSEPERRNPVVRNPNAKKKIVKDVYEYLYPGVPTDLELIMQYKNSAKSSDLGVCPAPADKVDYCVEPVCDSERYEMPSPEPGVQPQSSSSRKWSREKCQHIIFRNSPLPEERRACIEKGWWRYRENNDPVSNENNKLKRPRARQARAKKSLPSDFPVQNADLPTVDFQRNECYLEQSSLPRTHRKEYYELENTTYGTPVVVDQIGHSQRLQPVQRRLAESVGNAGLAGMPVPMMTDPNRIVRPQGVPKIILRVPLNRNQRITSNSQFGTQFGQRLIAEGACIDISLRLKMFPTCSDLSSIRKISSSGKFLVDLILMNSLQNYNESKLMNLFGKFYGETFVVRCAIVVAPILVMARHTICQIYVLGGILWEHNLSMTHPRLVKEARIPPERLESYISFKEGFETNQIYEDQSNNNSTNLGRSLMNPSVASHRYGSRFQQSSLSYPVEMEDFNQPSSSNYHAPETFETSSQDCYDQDFRSFEDHTNNERNCYPMETSERQQVQQDCLDYRHLEAESSANGYKENCEEQDEVPDLYLIPRRRAAQTINPEAYSTIEPMEQPVVDDSEGVADSCFNHYDDHLENDNFQMLGQTPPNHCLDDLLENTDNSGNSISFEDEDCDEIIEAFREENDAAATGGTDGDVGGTDGDADGDVEGKADSCSKDSDGDGDGGDADSGSEEGADSWGSVGADGSDDSDSDDEDYGSQTYIDSDTSDEDSSGDDEIENLAAGSFNMINSMESLDEEPTETHDCLLKPEQDETTEIQNGGGSSEDQRDQDTHSHDFSEDPASIQTPVVNPDDVGRVAPILVGVSEHHDSEKMSSAENTDSNNLDGPEETLESSEVTEVGQKNSEDISEILKEICETVHSNEAPNANPMTVSEPVEALIAAEDCRSSEERFSGVQNSNSSNCLGESDLTVLNPSASAKFLDAVDDVPNQPQPTEKMTEPMEVDQTSSDVQSAQTLSTDGVGNIVSHSCHRSENRNDKLEKPDVGILESPASSEPSYPTDAVPIHSQPTQEMAEPMEIDCDNSEKAISTEFGPAETSRSESSPVEVDAGEVNPAEANPAVTEPAEAHPDESSPTDVLRAAYNLWPNLVEDIRLHLPILASASRSDDAYLNSLFQQARSCQKLLVGSETQDIEDSDEETRNSGRMSQASTIPALDGSEDDCCTDNEVEEVATQPLSNADLNMANSDQESAAPDEVNPMKTYYLENRSSILHQLQMIREVDESKTAIVEQRLKKVLKCGDQASKSPSQPPSSDANPNNDVPNQTSAKPEKVNFGKNLYLENRSVILRQIQMIRDFDEDQTNEIERETREILRTRNRVAEPTSSNDSGSNVATSNRAPTTSNPNHQASSDPEKIHPGKAFYLENRDRAMCFIQMLREEDESDTAIVEQRIREVHAVHRSSELQLTVNVESGVEVQNRSTMEEESAQSSSSSGGLMADNQHLIAENDFPTGDDDVDIETIDPDVLISGKTQAQLLIEFLGSHYQPSPAGLQATSSETSNVSSPQSNQNQSLTTNNYVSSSSSKSGSQEPPEPIRSGKKRSIQQVATDIYISRGLQEPASKKSKLFSIEDILK